jgi:3-oxoadipate enol-lactonase
MVDLVETSRGRFGVRRSGEVDRPTLMFVAGLADEMSSWDPILDAFTDYQCITFDNRGVGTSPITDGPYTIRQLAEDAHALHAALRLDQVVAVGSSMGGAVCQEWSLAYPDDLSGLVLTNTWAEQQVFCDSLFEHWQRLAEGQQTTALIDSMLLFCFSAEFLQAHPEAVDEFRQMPIPDLIGFHAAAQACREHDTFSRLADISQPTLVVGGSYDILTRPQLSRRIAEAIPHARLEMLDAAHMIFAEDPVRWQQAVRGWLQVNFPYDVSPAIQQA